MRNRFVLALALASLATACEEKPTPVAEPASTTTATAAATAAPSASAGAVVQAVSSTAPTGSAEAPKPPDKENVKVEEANIDKTLPDIPTEKSKPPTIEEWKAGTVVNSQGKASRPEKCEMKIVREWLKIKCEGYVYGINDLDGFGAEGTDHFKAFEEGKWADIVVRLKENQALSTRIPRMEGDAALFTHWPKGAKKPNIIALGIGSYPTYASCGG